MRNAIRYVQMLHVCVVLALALTACAVTAPQTPAQRLAYVDGQFTAAVETASEMRDAGVLTPEQAQDIDPVIQRGNDALDAAWAALGVGRPDDALSVLRTVNSLLLELQRELREVEQ